VGGGSEPASNSKRERGWRALQLGTRPMEFKLAVAALPGTSGRHGRWLGGPARRGKEQRPLYRRRASFLVTGGRTGAPQGARGRTTPVGPRVTVRRYSDAKREASSACARFWGRSGLGGRVLGRRARGNRGNSAGAARRGRGAARLKRVGLATFDRDFLKNFE
jgi:hypothetical protein